MNWGDVPTWLGALVTAAALIAAFKVYKIESDRDARAATERREQFQAERRAQADKVAAWYAYFRPQYSSAPMTAFREQGWAAFIRNASDLPIYDVEIDFYYVIPNAPPGNVPSRRGSSDQIPVVPPQEETYIKTPSGVLDQVDAESKANHSVAIEFRDTAGARWRRDIYGKLTELSGG